MQMYISTYISRVIRRVKAQRIYIYIYLKDQQTIYVYVCIGSQIKKKTTDYIQRQEQKKLLILYNSPHKSRGISIYIGKKEKKKRLSFYITCYYFEKLINSICCFMEWCKAERKEKQNTRMEAP